MTLIGNPDERQAYFYMEGMNAPMGTVQLYGPDVQGILTSTVASARLAPEFNKPLTKLAKGGNYTVAMAIGATAARPPVSTPRSPPHLDERR